MKLFSILLNVMLLFLIISCAQGNKSKKEAIATKEDVVLNTKSNASKDFQTVATDTLKYAVHDGNIGAGGYDLVNYFTDDSAKLGDKKFTANYDGVDYWFLNEKNKNLFDQNPTKYLPAFGGWCSMNLAMGRATTPTYDNFSIVNDTLRLFEKTLSVNGKLLWQVNPNENKKQASKNYDEYVSEGAISPN